MKEVPKKIVVLGGSIAGMSAAQKLVERGVHMEIYDELRILQD